MKAIQEFKEKVPLWEIANVQNVERERLRDALGTPYYIETDSTRTFGGEEDTYAFELANGVLFIVELHVPYKHAIVISNLKVVTPEILEACKLIPGDFEAYPQAYVYR